MLPGACPPLSALCPPRVRFGRASKPCPPPVSASSVSIMYSPCVRSLSALRPLFASSGAPCVLASGFCPLVACCGAGPWHHKVKRNPPLLYCMPTVQFPWHSLGLHELRPLQVEKLFGVYAGIILYSFMYSKGCSFKLLLNKVPTKKALWEPKDFQWWKLFKRANVQAGVGISKKHEVLKGSFLK